MPMKTSVQSTITVNGEHRPLDAATTLTTLATELGIAEQKGVAIAVNGTVVPRGSWPAQALRQGDRVLVIRATQGG